MHELFPFRVKITVRGYEIDSFGHTNNAVYLHWLEHARWGLIGPSGVLPDEPGILPIVRHVEIDYRAETRFGDVVEVALWPRALRTTSFTIGSRITVLEALDKQRCGVVATSATQVITCVQQGSGKTPVPASWRAVFPSQDPGPDPAL